METRLYGFPFAVYFLTALIHMEWNVSVTGEGKEMSLRPKTIFIW